MSHDQKGRAASLKSDLLKPLTKDGGGRSGSEGTRVAGDGWYSQDVHDDAQGPHIT